MYEARSEPHEFVAGSESEALAKAVDYFGVAREDLTFRALEAEDVSGLGGRVVVVAQPTAARGGPRPGGERGDRDRGDRGDRGERRPRGGRGDRDRGGRGDRGGRDRGGRGERSDRGDRGERDRGDRGGRRDREERREQPAAEELEVTEPSVGTVRGAIGPVGEFVLGMVERMQLGPFEIAETEEDDFLVYQLHGPAAAALTGGDGRAPDALQLLANQAAGQVFEDEPKRIVIDVEGNREKRESLLTRIAERAAGRARETGRAVALEPMSGRDRRTIHVALRDEDDVATMSIGEGRYRQVVVVPEGAPEFEEARDAAEGARQSED